MAAVNAEMLHPEYLDGKLYGAELRDAFGQRLEEFNSWAATQEEVAFSGLTVALPSMNDRPEDVERVLTGLGTQQGVSDVEVLLMNAGNERATLNVAQFRGVEVVDVPVQRTFRADILNKSLESASHRHVLTMPAYSTPASNVMLAAAKRNMARKDDPLSRQVAGAYGVPLLDHNASKYEALGAKYLGAVERLQHPPAPAEKNGMGLLDAGCSIVDKEIIRDMGGYPKAYGAGGADGAMGNKLIDIENNYIVIEDGTMANHRTKGLGAFRSAYQVLLWQLMSRPHGYSKLLNLPFKNPF